VAKRASPARFGSPAAGTPKTGQGGYFDANWTRSPMDRYFTTGHCVLIEGNIISWKS